MLFPLPEAGLLRLHLLSEPLTERFFFFLELGVVDLAHTGFAKFASLHLAETVVLIVGLLGRVDQIEHVRADEQRAELLEVAVVLILDWENM